MALPGCIETGVDVILVEKLTMSIKELISRELAS